MRPDITLNKDPASVDAYAAYLHAACLRANGTTDIDPAWSMLPERVKNVGRAGVLMLLAKIERDLNER